MCVRMPRSIAPVLLSFALSAIGCAASRVSFVPCPRIADWAKASGPLARSVTLWTQWGGPFAKFCVWTEGDAAAKPLCDWILDNSSTEFMRNNVWWAIGCIGQRRAEDGSVARDLPASGRRRTSARRAELEAGGDIEVDWGVLGALPYLRISLVPDGQAAPADAGPPALPLDLRDE